MAAKENEIEIDRQRYETFRHMDKLRRQMLQIVVAVGSIAVVVLKVTNGDFSSLFAFAIGVIFILLAYVISRINKGIYANGLVLKEVGAQIGDKKIPTPSTKWSSSSHLIEYAIFILGFTCIIYAAYTTIITYCRG